jgi:hypothetical protein
MYLLVVREHRSIAATKGIVNMTVDWYKKLSSEKGTDMGLLHIFMKSKESMVSFPFLYFVCFAREKFGLSHYGETQAEDPSEQVAEEHIWT